MTFDNIIELLKECGFRRISASLHKWIMISEDYKIQITIEENIEGLTEEQEQRIKKRLKELGYLNDCNE